MHDGDESALQRREPAVPDLPQRPAELLLPGADGRVLPEPVEVPPAGAVTGVQEGAVGGPVRLGDRLLRSARDGPRAAQDAVLGDVGEDQFGAVPGHARVVPGEPGRLRAVGREPGAGDEPVPAVGEFAHRVAVLRRRPVERHRGHDPSYVGGSVPGELLQHAPHFAPFGAQPRVHPAQSAAHRGHGGQRARPRVRGVGLVRVESLVGEVHEHDERPLGAHLAGPGLSAVLDHPAAHVPGGRQHRLLRAVGASAYERAPSALRGPGFGPPRLVADEADELGVPVVRGGERRVDGRGPRSVRQLLHPVLSRSCAGSGRGRGRRSAAPRRERVRRHRGRGPGSRSPRGA